MGCHLHKYCLCLYGLPSLVSKTFHSPFIPYVLFYSLFVECSILVISTFLSSHGIHAATQNCSWKHDVYEHGHVSCLGLHVKPYE